MAGIGPKYGEHCSIDRCLDAIDNLTISWTKISHGCLNERFEALSLMGRAGVDLAEVCTVEVARTAEVVAVGGRLYYEYKLRAVTKAMVGELWKLVDYYGEVGNTLQVVGVQQVGFNIRMSTMCVLRKGVSVLLRWRSWSVPQKMEDFDDMFEAMQSVVVKSVILALITTIVVVYIRAGRCRQLWDGR